LPLRHLDVLSIGVSSSMGGARGSDTMMVASEPPGLVKPCSTTLVGRKLASTTNSRGGRIALPPLPLVVSRRVSGLK
jgi:hypothetical protein